MDSVSPLTVYHSLNTEAIRMFQRCKSEPIIPRFNYPVAFCFTQNILEKPGSLYQGCWTLLRIWLLCPTSLFIVISSLLSQAILPFPSFFKHATAFIWKSLCVSFGQGHWLPNTLAWPTPTHLSSLSANVILLWKPSLPYLPALKARFAPFYIPSHSSLSHHPFYNIYNNRQSFSSNYMCK